jgi:hypothetical protein
MNTNYLPLRGISDFISPIQTIINIKLLSENLEKSVPMNNEEILLHNEYSKIAEFLSQSNINYINMK